jgi:hypothetical protein
MFRMLCSVRRILLWQKKFDSVKSNSVYNLTNCLYPKYMQRVYDEVRLCEILNQRKCVYVQRHCNIVKLNSEIKSPSNVLCCATNNM